MVLSKPLESDFKAIHNEDMDFTQTLLVRTKKFSTEVDGLAFTFDGYIYNPLSYAWQAHELYLSQYVHPHVKALFLGMNPGPFGMMQTGVPFGEVNFVKNWMKIEVPVEKPQREHPNRPVLGFNCPRSEGSGRRFWGLFSQRYPNPSSFFDSHAVFNYCPLGFLEAGRTAKNFTPDHLPREEKATLERLCDAYLADILDLICPEILIGVGKYAQVKLEKVNKDNNRVVSSIIHPSPGNPMANKGWNEKTTEKLIELGVWQ